MSDDHEDYIVKGRRIAWQRRDKQLRDRIAELENAIRRHRDRTLDIRGPSAYDDELWATLEEDEEAT